MTAYVNRGYEIADEFRRRGVPVIMGGVHPSFMTKEALTHCDAVCIGEAELVIPKILDDLEQGVPAAVPIAPTSSTRWSAFRCRATTS